MTRESHPKKEEKEGCAVGELRGNAERAGEVEQRIRGCMGLWVLVGAVVGVGVGYGRFEIRKK